MGVGSFPRAVAVNSVTNKIYVANYQGASVTVVDGVTTGTSTLAVGPEPVALAIDETLNKIYVANQGSNTVSVIDGNTNQVTTITVGSGPSAIAFNGVTNKVYVANSDGTLAVIDGTSGSTATLTVGSFSGSLAVNRATDEIAIADGNSSNVTLIAEQNVQTIPLSTTITPLPGNQIIGTAPPPASTFTFTTNSTYAPNSPQVLGVFLRLDTWRGPWVAASGSGNTFTCPSASCQFPTLTVGPHILFAYAEDAQAATANGLSSPVIGTIAAYQFVVVPVQTSTLLTSNSNPSAAGSSVIFTATVTTTGTQTPTGTVTFVDGSTTPATTLGTGTLTAASATTATATLTISNLGPGPHSITAVYGGDQNGGASVSNGLTQTVGAQSTTTLLGASPNPAFLGGSIQFTATVSGAVAGTPTGTVNFLNNGAMMGSGTLNGSGVATFSISSLALGTYSITAVYLGDANNMATPPAAVPVLSLTVGAASFVISGSPTTVTLTAGSTASYIVSVTPEGNFTSAVTLTCPTVAPADSNVGLPASATCSFSPASVTPGTSTVTSICSIVTSATAGIPGSPNSRAPKPPQIYILLGWLAGLALLTGLMVDMLRRRKVGIFQRYAMGILLTAALGLALSSCHTATTTQTTTATTGLFDLTFTGTSGSTTNTTTVTITINAPSS